MNKSTGKKIKTIIAFAAAIAIATAFMPISASEVHAAIDTSKAVTGLKVAATEAHAITLQWDSFTGATGYQVYKASSAKGTYSLLSTTKSTSFKRTDLTTNLTCYYKVRAYYSASNSTTYSKYSAVVAGTPKAFDTNGAVKGLNVSAYTDTTITLKWNAYSCAQGYEVYKATSSKGTYEKIHSTKDTSFKRTKLTTNKTCYYKVRAYKKNSNGTYSYSKYSQVVPGTPIGFDTSQKVGGFKLSAKTYDSITLVWNSYPEAAGYKIYKARKKNGKYEKIATTKETTFKRTNLTTNKTCYYKVRAYKKKGNKTVHSKYTSPVEGTPRLATPTISVVSAKDGVSISWKAISGASNYQVYRATKENGDYSKIKTTKETSFKNKSITENKKYYYKVRAYRTVKGKNKHGSFSKAQLGMKAVLSKVSGVKASSKDTCIGLSWKAVSEASGYEVYRATGSNDSKKYTNVGKASSASFNDYNVANGLTYYYKIRAYKTINGAKVYGDFSTVGFSRSAVVSTAVAWLGCKESNKSNKPIVDLYNSNMGTKFSYKTPWCAIFVSAVAIKSGTTSIIVRGSYCPSVINVYKKSKVSNYKYGAGASYVPKAGDVIFFDWNRNGVPDHTGLVASVSGNTIKTIEGNYHDAVGYRTFSVGYRYVQGYGLPNYDDANGILFTGSSKSSVGCGELAAMGIGTEPEGIDELGSEYDFVEQNVDENIGEDEDISDYDKMVYMVSKVRASAETEGIDCSETQYYAAFIYKLCAEEGLEASIMTVEDEEGTTHAWVEVCLDDTWYTVDASKDADQIAEFEPESTDIEGAVAEPTEEDMPDADVEDTDVEDTDADDAEAEDADAADAEAVEAE